MTNSFGEQWFACLASHHLPLTGRNRYCIDKNYASVLIIWDRIFGTFAAEEEQVVYGLTTPVQSFDPLELQFGHYRDMMRRMGTVNGWQEKVSVLMKGPGWEPGKPRLGLIQDIPDISRDNVLPAYEPDVPVSRQLYCGLHFLIVLFFHVQLAQSVRRLTQTLLLLVFAFIFISLTSFGALMEGKKFGERLELFRCFFFVFLDHTLLPHAVSDQTVVSLAIKLLFFASLLYWTVRHLNEIQIFEKISRDVSRVHPIKN